MFLRSVRGKENAFASYPNIEKGARAPTWPLSYHGMVWLEHTSPCTAQNVGVSQERAHKDDQLGLIGRSQQNW